MGPPGLRDLSQSPNPCSISDLIPPSAEEKSYLEVSENADCPVSDGMLHKVINIDDYD